ncbi:helix-turn-helix domain-containing protein [Pararhizobium sp.]|uniref:helix-turn-helix domain-containing protein n=1 Tax=Pararhizobium sp. TaxID=1977563 RepID=UPI003D108C29
MAGRPEVAKTELGERLRAIRKTMGDLDREEFASRLGISAQVLGKIERGDSEPDLAVLAAYRSEFGVDLNWLATGEGEMFSANSPTAITIPAARTIGTTIDWVGKLVFQVYRDEKVAVPQGAAIGIVSAKVVELMQHAGPSVVDLNNVAALLPWLEMKIRAELKEAADQPGTGKHSA